MTTLAKFRFDRLQRSGKPLATATPPEDKPFVLLGLTKDVGETEQFKRLAGPPTFSLTASGRLASKLNETVGRKIPGIYFPDPFSCQTFQGVGSNQRDESSRLQAMIPSTLTLPFRLIQIRWTPHKNRTGDKPGGSKAPNGDSILGIATNLLDVPAEIIALIYSQRWIIDDILRFLKQFFDGANRHQSPLTPAKPPGPFPIR